MQLADKWYIYNMQVLWLCGLSPWPGFDSCLSQAALGICHAASTNVNCFHRKYPFQKQQSQGWQRGRRPSEDPQRNDHREAEGAALQRKTFHHTAVMKLSWIIKAEASDFLFGNLYQRITTGCYVLDEIRLSSHTFICILHYIRCEDELFERHIYLTSDI